MREAVCRRFVLGMVNEALKAQATASESLRPSKRRKPNSHSVGVISSFASPQRKSGRSDTPSTPKERRNLDVGTSDDDIEQDVFSGSEPLASKAIPQSTRRDGLIWYDRSTRQLEH
jgi:hypothetical protein